MRCGLSSAPTVRRDPPLSSPSRRRWTLGAYASRPMGGQMDGNLGATGQGTGAGEEVLGAAAVLPLLTPGFTEAPALRRRTPPATALQFRCRHRAPVGPFAGGPMGAATTAASAPCPPLSPLSPPPTPRLGGIAARPPLADRPPPARPALHAPSPAPSGDHPRPAAPRGGGVVRPVAGTQDVRTPGAKERVVNPRT